MSGDAALRRIARARRVELWGSIGSDAGLCLAFAASLTAVLAGKDAGFTIGLLWIPVLGQLIAKRIAERKIPEVD